MNYSKQLLFFPLVFLLFSPLVFFNEADARPVDFFYVEDSTCTNTSATATGITIVDGVDFEFEVDKQYLLIATTKWGGTGTSDEYIVHLTHGSTIFAGSESIVEPQNASGGCGIDNDFYSYFFYTIWEPLNETQADENVFFEFESLDGSNMQFEDQTLMVFRISGELEDGVDFLFDEKTNPETLLTNFATNAPANITWTPENEGDDWFVMGSNRLDTGSATISFESRLFINGTEPNFPLIRQEGEDPTNEIFVQTFARVLTLSNTTETILESQSGIDESGAGTHTRLYSSIFAVNMALFGDHVFSWTPNEQELDTVDFADNILNNTITVPTNGTQLFILADFSSQDTSSSNMINGRVQINNTDTLPNQTSDSHDFNNEWDADDRIRWTLATIENVVNGTFIIEVDSSEQNNSQDAEIIDATLIVILLTNIFPFINNQTDTMSFIDDPTITVNRLVNQTNPISIVDNPTFNIFDNVEGNPMSMIDNVTLTRIITFNAIGNPMSMVDDPTITVTRLVNQTNPISMVDDPTFSIFDNVIDNPMSMVDDPTLTVNRLFTDTNPISMIDTVTFALNKMFNQTDTISIVDDPTFKISDLVQGNPMSMIDNATLTVNRFLNQTNPISMVDDPTITVNRLFTDTNPISMVDDPTFNYNLNNLNEGNPISMKDQVQFQISFFVAPPIVIPPTTGGGGSGTGTTVPTIPDSDGDGILDTVDSCPLEPENFNGFEDADGCPDLDPAIIDEPLPISVADLGFPFGFNELSIIDDYVNLETDSPQPQVEDLGIRWLGDEPVTISTITVGDSPFEIVFQEIPETFGNNQIGFTQAQLIYTIQEPNKVCDNVFDSNCVANVTYEIPVVISGEVRGKTVIAQGSITIDNSNRFNPYWIVFLVLFIIPALGFIFWKRRRSSAPPKSRTLLKVTESKSTGQIIVKRDERLKKGTTRRILNPDESKSLFRRK